MTWSRLPRADPHDGAGMDGGDAVAGNGDMHDVDRTVDVDAGVDEYRGDVAALPPS